VANVNDAGESTGEWYEQFGNVSRVEVIEDGRRAYTGWGVSDVKTSLQDEGRTLKVFVTGLPMHIAEAAVDVAAKAMYIRHGGIDWNAESESIQGLFKRDAKEALEAAAPFLAGAVGLDPECGCQLKSCIHHPTLTLEGPIKFGVGDRG